MKKTMKLASFIFALTLAVSVVLTDVGMEERILQQKVQQRITMHPIRQKIIW